MNFKVYVTSKKIDKFHLKAIDEYKKRLSRYCKIELIVVKKHSELFKLVLEKSYKILISTNRKDLSSEELSSKINLFGVNGNSDISIVISDNKGMEYYESISLTPMDMDLGLQTVIMFEQIYRSYRIINNEPYHK